ncbi:7 transmembrane receptor-like protein 2 [Sarcoptes scabiei]|uniref:7 transmembrane receptor-like protein 2 n=1 Tax=Sarcoptes scabiei TaxID=52283 RepID=A0A132A2E5_SARSC|nr:7 transmembrane receptor-like protein 2 [Sarcoptes scabiei]
MASINWMFIEGFQLHSRVTVSILRKDAPFKLYHFFGWGKLFRLDYLGTSSIPYAVSIVACRFIQFILFLHSHLNRKGIPMILVSAWAIQMSFTMETVCWNGYAHSIIIWIVVGPMILALLVS